MHDAIVSAAVELFLTEGYEQTSIRKIAEKIEYTPGAIYSYFKDKDEILFEIHLRGFEKLFEQLRPALEGVDPLDRLYRIGKLYIDFALQNPQYYDLMFIGLSMARSIKEKQEWESGEGAYGVLRQIVGECIEKKLLPAGDVDAAAYTFWSMVHGMVSLVLRGRCMAPPAERPNLVYGSYEYLWKVMSNQRKPDGR
ncbi:MAG: TetR/AcrR family transcriptional regulator [Candidatus Zixiibacteriota bacterium]